jgi:hypothetical protein
VRLEGENSVRVNGRGRRLAAGLTGVAVGSVVGFVVAFSTSDLGFGGVFGSGESSSGGDGGASTVAALASGTVAAALWKGGDAVVKPGAEYTLRVSEDTPIRLPEAAATSTTSARLSLTPVFSPDPSRGAEWEWGARPLLAGGKSGRPTGPGVVLGLRVRY